MFSTHHPKHHYNSLKNAWRGFYKAFLTQRNLRLELFIGIVVIIAGYLFNFDFLRQVIVIVTVLLVLSFEMVNTSIEAMVDATHPDRGEVAKFSKDTAATAMLLVSILALIVGIYLFVPIFWSLH